MSRISTGRGLLAVVAICLAAVLAASLVRGPAAPPDYHVTTLTPDGVAESMAGIYTLAVDATIVPITASKSVDPSPVTVDGRGTVLTMIYKAAPKPPPPKGVNPAVDYWSFEQVPQTERMFGMTTLIALQADRRFDFGDVRSVSLAPLGNRKRMSSVTKRLRPKTTFADDIVVWQSRIESPLRPARTYFLKQSGTFYNYATEERSKESLFEGYLRTPEQTQ